MAVHCTLITRYSEGELERLIFARDYKSLSSTWIDQARFALSEQELGFIDNKEGLRFIYRSRRWSAIFYPITRLNVKEINGSNHVQLTHRLNVFGRSVIYVVYLFMALVLVFSSNGGEIIVPIIPFALLGALCFAAPMMLIARQAKKETCYFLEDLIKHHEEFNQ